MAEEQKGFPGPKTKDSKRDKEPDAPHMTAGANADYQNRQQGQFQDTTSSSASANVPGQHGRDGGEINEVSNNPAPAEEVLNPEPIPAPEEVQDKDKEVKKL